MLQGLRRVELCWERGLPLVGTKSLLGDITEGYGLSIL